MTPDMSALGITNDLIIDRSMFHSVILIRGEYFRNGENMFVEKGS